MEAAFRIWKGSPIPLAFPWPFNPTPFRGSPPPGRTNHDIGAIADQVEGNLRAQGKNPRSEDLYRSALRRAQLAVNELGPALFPLIAMAEERVIGTRDLPPNGTGPAHRRTRMYELHGIIDVVTDIELGVAPETNVLKNAIRRSARPNWMNCA